MENIIIAVITVLVPSITTIIVNNKTLRYSKKHSAQQSILQMIIEDHVRVSEHLLPENYQNICNEWDKYKANGGNSYMHNKIDVYFEWYKKIRKGFEKNEK